jgi:serine protease Do
MKYSKNFLTLLTIAFFAMGLSLSAQDAPPAPKSDPAEQLKETPQAEQNQPESKLDSKQDESTTQTQEPDQETPEKKEKQDSSDSKSSDEKPSSDEQPKSDDGKQDDSEKADEKKDDEKKDDEKKADDEKADDQKSDDKKADDQEADEQEGDDEPADEEMDEDEQADRDALANAMRINPWSRDNERVDSFSKKSGDFVHVFEPVVASANASTLQVMSGKRQIALGTVVDSNGFVLTKASELRGQLGCKLPDGTISEAKVIGIDPETDLALLKVDVENLNVIQWSQDPTPVTGQWVATPKADDDLPTIGVVSVDARDIPPSKPFIGITMEDIDKETGVKILSVVARSPADSSDLWVNDVILKIDDAEIENIAKLRKELEQYDINDRVTLLIRRGKKEMKIKLTLAERDKVSPENLRSNQQNSMGSILSRRRKNFPSSFQHDSMLNSKTCGGPIVDLSGKVVGINIARAGRVSSLALTAASVQPVIARLKSGELSPEIVNKAKIDAIDAELKEIETKLGKLPENKIDLERKYNVEKARLEELEKSMEDLKSRMSVIDEKATEYKTELDSVRKELRNIERVRQRLEADRKQLATGSR